MEFEWDEKKNQTNIIKHQISFEEAAKIFTSPRLTYIDTRKKYGEIRIISVGTIYSKLVVFVVHAQRNNHIRIISARTANQKERKAYYAYLKKTS